MLRILSLEQPNDQVEDVVVAHDGQASTASTLDVPDAVVLLILG